MIDRSSSEDNNDINDNKKLFQIQDKLIKKVKKQSYTFEDGQYYFNETQ
ncbi:unnamed protein product [Paramecium pentaurelia]|uniref:Uncharacterized protein n=1 Tax=Paramecium pentaurelia TaxID=43138 RepID=A0A8S1SZ85_9CILI|nr:unnamed protein product [Paramecium pentaurelia]